MPSLPVSLTTPPTICMALYSFDFGGSERLGLQLSKHYLNNGFRVVCCATRRGRGPLMRQFEDLGIPCLALDLESLSRIGRLRGKSNLRSWLSRHEVICVHAQHMCVLSDVHKASHAAGVKVQIVTEHTAEPILNDRRYASVTARMAYRANAITAINEVIRDAIASASSLPKVRVRVIENGIDLARFVGQSKAGRDCCEVIWLGRLHPDKDILNALRAFREVTLSNPKVYLNVVGDGEDRGKAEEYVREHGLGNNVRFSGALADPSIALQTADIFLLSSATEGTPLAMLEALSCGLPVVATAVGGIPDVISGDVGIIVPPSDASALACGILSLAESSELRIRMGQSARQLAECRFSELKMAAAYIELIENQISAII
ncbi:glycosyltransferase [Lacipirellula limnantheis]|uniref:Glycogen synthase n=1 Tax=Lacipirellula limnantheis TaxID=2528024 RepID=A0A517TY88_9BACT|nr:glycosyltransferase [Lacipirellula limnantheis]QDT73343.1 Glycogen synthase [Lacipirellula limnantheis]